MNRIQSEKSESVKASSSTSLGEFVIGINGFESGGEAEEVFDTEAIGGEFEVRDTAVLVPGLLSTAR